MDIKFYMSLFVRRLPYFLFFVALGSAIGLSLASVLPPTYVAQAKLLMEGGQIPSNLATSTVITDPVETLQVVQQRIMTRANILEISNRLGIYASQPNLPADQIVTDFRSRVTISRVPTPQSAGNRNAPSSVLVNVAFTAKTSAMAATVTNEIVTLILQENVAMRTGVAGQTLDFFVQEVDRLDKALAKQGATILEFKDKNKDALPDSLQFRQNQEVLETNRLQTLETNEASLNDQRTKLVQLFDATGQVAASTGPQTPEQRQLQALRDQLTNALAVYATGNPRIKLLEQQVAAQEKIVAGQVAGAAAATGGQAMSAFDIQLASLDAQLDYLKTQKDQINVRLEKLRAAIDATPGVTIALDALQRDYNNVQNQYTTAVSNEARAETGELIETLAKGQRISIMEQAVAPRSPTSPNRPVIAAAGIGGGMFVGLAVVLLLEMLNRAIRRPVDLTNRLGITPFGTLPFMRTAGETRRRTLTIGFALVMALAGIPVLLWVINTFYMPLDLLIDRLVNQLGMRGLINQLRGALGI